MFEKKEDIQASLEKKVLLLNSPEKQKIYNVMNSISPNNKLSTLNAEIVEAKEKIRIESELTKLRNEGKTVFTEKEIINECVKFNMHFANSKSFDGELTFDYVDKVIKFVEENKLKVSDYEWSTNVFIMTNAKYKNHNFQFKPDTDPIIFYKIIEKGETFFVLVSDNLKYNKFINRLKGFYRYDLVNKGIVIMTIINLIVFTIVKLCSWGGYFWECFGGAFAAALITLFFSALFEMYDSEVNTHQKDKQVNIPQRNNILSFFIIYGLLVFSINYIVDSIAYTISPKYVESVEKESMSLNEVEENNFVVQPNKEYFKTWKERKLYTGHYFYYTVQKDTSNLQFLNTDI